MTDLDETTARELVAYIRSGLDELRDAILRLWTGQGWLVLGYPTWVEMCAAEFPFRLALPRDERPALVADLKSEGMSGPAIAGALGISEGTVRNDLAGSQNYEAAPTVGLDGKTYAPRQPREEPSVAPEVIDPFAGWSEDENLLRKRLAGGETVVLNMRSGGHGSLMSWADARGLFVRIDRRTEWGNPFEIPDDGNRDVVIAKYAEHYLPHKTTLQDRVSELRGKALGCWCAPEPCHGDILKTLAER